MVSDSSLQYIAQCENSFIRKRRYTLIVFFMVMACNGLKHGFIFSSIWAYTKRYGAKPWFAGLAIAAYDVGSITSAFLVGKVYDRTRRTKDIMTTLVSCELIGCLTYSLPVSQWLLLCGRLIQGLGGGFRTIIVGEISCITVKHELVGTFSIVESGKLVGILISPLFTMSFQYVDFEIGNLRFDCTNFPILFISLVWFVLFITCRAVLSNVAKDFVMPHVKTKVETEGLLNKVYLKEPDKDRDMPVEKDTELSDIENENTNRKWYCQIPAITLCSFLTSVNFRNTETLITLLSELDFSWNTIRTNFAFLGGALVTFAVLLTLRFSRIQLPPHLTLYFGLGGIITSNLLWISYQLKRKEYTVSLALFCASIIFASAADPLVIVSCSALLTSLTPLNFRGIVFGFMDFSIRAGCLVSPIAGSMAVNNLTICSTFITLLSLVATFAFSLSFCLSKHYKE